MIVNFHPGPAPTDFVVHASHGFSEFLIVENRIPDKHTYAMSLLNDAWDLGDTIRIWYQGDTDYTYKEFTHGSVVEGKVLRPAHNLQKLWKSGTLGMELRTGFAKGNK